MRTKVKYLLFAVILLASVQGYSQNVGIGIAAPLEKLHVLGNVRVSNLAGVGTRLTGADANGTLVVVAAGANGQVLTQTAGGPVWQANSGWLTTGNAGTNGGTTLVAGVNFLGTTDNQNIDFRTNNIYRGRFSNLGEFFVGTLNTVVTGDMMNGVSNVTFPWAINGYSAFDGSGVYGQITSGATIYGAVQGEYYGTHAQGAGVRGLTGTAVAGTSFVAPHSGVSGGATTAGAYNFGVYGSGGTTTRSGGVLGNDYGIAIGGLGYYAFNGLDYSVYGFGQGYTTGLGTGRMGNMGRNISTQSTVVGMDQPNTNIGLGIYGGVMGGWVRGMEYGMHVHGTRTSLYVDGKTFTNEAINQLVTTEDGSRISTYVPSSATPDVYARGKGELIAGAAVIAFDENFSQIVGDPEGITITVTPIGNSNGIYLQSFDGNGFSVKENNGGNSNVEFTWIAMATRRDFEKQQVSPEILTADFDQKMRGVMFNENNKEDVPGAVWWDGENVRFDAPPAKVANPRDDETRRPNGEQAAKSVNSTEKE